MSLVLENLTKRFGPVVALDGISFTVDHRQVFRFLLPTRPAPPPRGPRRRTWGSLPEERGLYPRLEVLEQLVFFASLYAIPRKVAADRAREWLARFRIPEYEKRRAEELSKGNQQKVQLIAAILHEPDVLIMDEPFVGLDPVNVSLLKEAFGEMRRRGTTLIFSTHQMEMVEELCEAVVR